ncbi:hypothetical protein AO1008_02433 [Aspergillus oryzae 100-8]|uniref:GPI anchored protein n=1 Tax=Aspergillus oryzae (strain 3.042) TaxID=1160506 RepID=I8U460_ASPO3|nr:hypothetical protein Ao3042_01865 [Aspergillus oryzae 3.042]KDE76625.1 hypothetical protein AO1008_02433 [Aspergillus oryzae 100-8]|eukprot:EIT81610.1 hypothetical protein Ao3042_01865 [Aspergillus oryzae 3.042]
MKTLTTLTISLVAITTTAVAKEVGYFQSSDCVDSSGFESCYEDADQRFANCVSNNCAGGSKGCVESCGGNPECVQSKCPNLGIDCINVCDCVKNIEYIQCAATSCWNQIGLMSRPWSMGAHAGVAAKVLISLPDLGFSNLTRFHGPGQLPANGTETLYNTGGVISTPVSGNTFTWTIHDIPHPVTAAATNKAVPTKSESGGKSVTTTAESGGRHEFRLSLWTLVSTIGAGYLLVR